MRRLSLDLSTHCGWAVLEGEDGAVPSLKDGGCLDLVRVVAPYPWNYVGDVERMAAQAVLLAVEQRPDEVVIEETNGGGRAGRMTQKLLEQLHLGVLQRLGEALPELPVVYISSGDWRRTIGSVLSKEDKRINAALSKAKRQGKEALKEAKKRLKVRGKINKKHVAVRWVNRTYNLTLPQGENDLADAICIGASRYLGAPLSTGSIDRKPKEPTPHDHRDRALCPGRVER